MKYEYHVIETLASEPACELAVRLNRYAEDGWRVVHVLNFRLILERVRATP